MKILVVDDNLDLCETLRDILKDEGHEVLTAYDGKSALELACRERLDLVFRPGYA